MREKWIVTAGSFRAERNTEAEAVSVAVDYLADCRAEAGRGWDEGIAHYPVQVSRVMYESGRCDERAPTFAEAMQGFMNACDFQLFPLDEEEMREPVDSISRAVFPKDLPGPLKELTEQFINDIVQLKEKAALEGILRCMPMDRVSMFGVDGIKFLNEEFGDGTKLLRYKNDGCYAVGQLDYLDQEPWDTE